jgi:manganese-dependent inorganic pyrophosphatase
LGYVVPPAVGPWNAVDDIWLVDTHHPNQLPPDLPEARVTRITDHHPGGSANRYPNAQIQNEAVGAAATLITERFEEYNVSIPADLARLLQAAIVSNTLDFRAPATSSRDRAAYERLRSIKAADRVLFEHMQQARRASLAGETRLILRKDTKTFDTAYGAVIVSQLEAPGALELLERSDLAESLEEIAAETNCASAIVNLVDTGICESAVVATDLNIALMLSVGLHQPPNNDGVIRANRLLQRKTDIVPYIVKSGH